MNLTLGRVKQLRLGCSCGCNNCGNKPVNGNIITDSLSEILPMDSKGNRRFITEVQIDNSSIVLLAAAIAAAGFLIKHI